LDQDSAFAADEFVVGEGSDWAGRSLAELDLRNRFGVMVVAIKRDGRQLLTLRAEDRVERGDTLLVMGTPAGIARLDGEYRGVREGAD
jgi:K+/H+ antiporter YhaU regulatory subunit KhtT